MLNNSCISSVPMPRPGDNASRFRALHICDHMANTEESNGTAGPCHHPSTAESGEKPPKSLKANSLQLSQFLVCRICHDFGCCLLVSEIILNQNPGLSHCVPPTPQPTHSLTHVLADPIQHSDCMELESRPQAEASAAGVAPLVSETGNTLASSYCLAKWMDC